MKTEYTRTINKSSLIITPEKDYEEEKESMEMFRYNQIPYFLKMEAKKRNISLQFCYDITGRRSLEQLLEYKPLDYFMLCRILYSLDQACIQAEDFMMTEDDILLEPEFIFADSHEEQMSYCYLPGNQVDICGQFKEFMGYLLKTVDHKDELAVQFAYGVYQQVAEERTALHKVLKDYRQNKYENNHVMFEQSPVVQFVKEDTQTQFCAGSPLVREKQIPERSFAGSPANSGKQFSESRLTEHSHPDSRSMLGEHFKTSSSQFSPAEYSHPCSRWMPVGQTHADTPLTAGGQTQAVDPLIADQSHPGDQLTSVVQFRADDQNHSVEPSIQAAQTQAVKPLIQTAQTQAVKASIAAAQSQPDNQSHPAEHTCPDPKPLSDNQSYLQHHSANVWKQFGQNHTEQKKYFKRRISKTQDLEAQGEDQVLNVQQKETLRKQAAEKLKNMLRRKIYTNRSKEEEEDAVFEADEEEEIVSSNPTVCLMPETDGVQNRFVYQGADRSRDFHCMSGRMILGSDRQESDICIPLPMVSRVHARVLVDAQGTFLEDLNSTNGTHVNGELLQYKERRMLEKGDIISLAGESYSFH